MNQCLITFVNTSVLRRFEALHVKVPESGCWLWLGALAQPPALPYGYFKVSGHQHYAHRWAYANFRCDPGAAYVLHRCDVPMCVNPAHLFVGSKLDNALDRDRKGRGAKGARHGMYNNGHKITEGVAAEIRIAEGTQVEVAAKYGVSRSLVGYIKQGKRWLR